MIKCCQTRVPGRRLSRAAWMIHQKRSSTATLCWSHVHSPPSALAPASLASLLVKGVSHTPGKSPLLPCTHLLVAASMTLTLPLMRLGQPQEAKACARTLFKLSCPSPSTKLHQALLSIATEFCAHAAPTHLKCNIP
eukprot:scaffold141304_cov16-Tisochrysis_lutea.AAC.2